MSECHFKVIFNPLINKRNFKENAQGFLRYLIKLTFVLTPPRISYIIFIIQICFLLSKMWLVMIFKWQLFLYYLSIKFYPTFIIRYRNSYLFYRWLTIRQKANGRLLQWSLKEAGFQRKAMSSSHDERATLRNSQQLLLPAQKLETMAQHLRAVSLPEDQVDGGSQPVQFQGI